MTVKNRLVNNNLKLVLIGLAGTLFFGYLFINYMSYFKNLHMFYFIVVLYIIAFLLSLAIGCLIIGFICWFDVDS